MRFFTSDIVGYPLNIYNSAHVHARGVAHQHSASPRLSSEASITTKADGAQDSDSLSHVIEYTATHDAMYAFHYLDENNKASVPFIIVYRISSSQVSSHDCSNVALFDALVQ